MTSIVQILPLSDDQSCLLLHGRHITRLNGGKVELLYTHKDIITRAAAIHQNTLAISDVKKTVLFLDLDTMKERTRGALDKSPMSAAFDAQGRLLIGDKFGDIIRYDEEGGMVPEVIAGCVSMVTDLLATSRFIIMSDRDEKIRLINAQSPVLIERFLLHHTEYVASMILIGDDRLVSISGDGRLILWDLFQEDPIQIIQAAESFDPVGISINKDKSMIAYALDKSNLVHFISIKDGRLCEEGKIVELPKGHILSTLRYVGDQLVVAGKTSASEGDPFVAIVLDANVDASVDANVDASVGVNVIQPFTELSKSLHPETQAWSQIARSHLRKRKFPRCNDEHPNEGSDEDVDNDE